jgi:hypothetical protein
MSLRETEGIAYVTNLNKKYASSINFGTLKRGRTVRPRASRLSALVKGDCAASLIEANRGLGKENGRGELNVSPQPFPC